MGLQRDDAIAGDWLERSINHIFASGLTLASILSHANIDDELAARLLGVIDALDDAVDELRSGALHAAVQERGSRRVAAPDEVTDALKTRSDGHRRQERHCSDNGFDFGIERRADDAVLRARGEIDLACAEEWAVGLDELLQCAGSKVEVDLARVRYVDAAGIGQLVRAYADATARQVQLTVTGANSTVRRVIGVLALDYLFGATLQQS